MLLNIKLSKLTKRNIFQNMLNVWPFKNVSNVFISVLKLHMQLSLEMATPHPRVERGVNNN